MNLRVYITNLVKLLQKKPILKNLALQYLSQFNGNFQKIIKLLVMTVDYFETCN